MELAADGRQARRKFKHWTGRNSVYGSAPFEVQTLGVVMLKRKCRVLCANHHQKHTIQQFGYKKWAIEL